MDKIIVDENYAGLVKNGSYYKLEGNLTGEIIEITIPLYVTGSIEAGTSIKASAWIEAGRWIEASEWIEVGKWVKAGKWIEAGKWIKAGGSIKAGESIEAGESINLFGIKTEKLFLFHGTFLFHIWIMDTHMKIGCQLKTKEEWLKIYNSEAGEKLAQSMGDDGSMWAMKDIIIGFCK